jgi:hypothetical protein
MTDKIGRLTAMQNLATGKAADAFAEKMERYDVSADHNKHEYYVIKRSNGYIVAIFRYKARNESSRAVAHGRAILLRAELARGNGARHAGQ